MALRNVLVIAVSLLLTSAAFAQKNKLEVGSKAPAIEIKTWVKGSEVKEFQPGRTYIVEFWATWCPPCRKSIPHLTKLQEELGPEGLTIIGVSTEKIDEVRPFVQRQGKRMEYTVAVDDRNSTSRAWMRAAGQKGIPTAFIVGPDGRIQHIGNPLATDFDTIVKKIVKGRYDARLMEKAKPAREAITRARRMKNWKTAESTMDELIAQNPRVFADLALERFEMMIVDQDSPKAAYAYVAQLQKLYANDVMMLEDLAAKIAADPKIKKEYRDMDVAMDVAKSIQRVPNHDSARALATQAMVHFHAGQYNEAVQKQTQAFFKAQPAQKAQFKRTLDKYQQTAQRAGL